MAENATEVLAGGAVLAAAIGFLVYAGLDTGLGAENGSYPLTASFRSVEGISVGSDVRLAGVKVGSITELKLNPATFFADARISVQDDILLPDDTTILISSEGLLGGNFVELVPGGSPVNLGPGEEIVDTQGAIGIVALLMRFVGAMSGDPAPADAAP
jgi:phospholipid/cholesterol/gamma-HCH transport system substrate-binding protein